MPSAQTIPPERMTVLKLPMFKLYNGIVKIIMTMLPFTQLNHSMLLFFYWFGLIVAFEEPTLTWPSSGIPSFLTVDTQDDFNLLNSFSHGSSLGILGLWVQHLLHTLCGYVASAMQHCLQALTIWINILISGKSSPWLSLALASWGLPWLTRKIKIQVYVPLPLENFLLLR